MAAKKKAAKKKPTPKLEFHSANFSGAYKLEDIKPSSFDPQSQTPESLMSLINSDVRKPSWKKNKYPVTMEQYAKLVAQASSLDTKGGMSLSPNDKSKMGDTDEESNKSIEDFGDFPEDDNMTASMSLAAPSVLSKFETIPATGWVPPDCVSAAGPEHVIVAVNSEFRIYNKLGGMLVRHQYNAFFSGVLPNSDQVKVFDPRAIWDHYNQRYVMIVAATQNAPARSWCCIAISKTANPMGSWWVYALDAALDGSTATGNWMDYPMLGFDPQGIYISMNMFKGNSFQYAKLRILNKNELYNGLPVRWFDFWNLKNNDGSLAFTVQACSHYRGNGGGPAYLINNFWGANNKLTLWTLNNPLALWSGSAPTLSRVAIGCRAYDIPPAAIQKGSATRIATNDNRLLNAVYQHAGGVKRIWTCHNTKISWQGDTEARSALQWYEIDVPSNSVKQQNAYGQKGAYYFFPVIQTDIARNAYVVFSRCSKDEFACMRITGRKVTGVAHDLESSVLVKAGESAHNSGRFGDYFGIGRDGNDASRIYAVGEYAESSGNWGTYVVTAKY
jgi:hypothetical protein